MKSGRGGGSETEERALSQLLEGVEDLADEAAGFLGDISFRFFSPLFSSYSSAFSYPFLVISIIKQQYSI